MQFLILTGALLLAASASFSAEAPKFSLRQLNGKTVNVGALIGKKVVVLNFWASWCSACEEEIPALVALKASPGAENVEFFGINVGESSAQIRYFVEKNKYPYPILMDTDRTTSRLFALTSVPATIILGKDGKITYKAHLPPKNYSFK
jgi:peroxiredoxin